MPCESAPLGSGVLSFFRGCSRLDILPVVLRRDLWLTIGRLSVRIDFYLRGCSGLLQVGRRHRGRLIPGRPAALPPQFGKERVATVALGDLRISSSDCSPSHTTSSPLPISSASFVTLLGL